MKKLLQFLTICAVVIITPGSVWADTHYVDPAGSNTPPYTTPATAAHSIQDAINAAINGDVINVAAGTYSDYSVEPATGLRYNVNVNKQLTIVGDPTMVDMPIVDAGGAAKSVAFWINANGVNLSGFDSRNASEDGGVGGAALYIVSGSNTVENNQVSGSTYGIQVSGNSNTVNDNVVKDNTKGIVIAGVFDNNTFEGNDIYDNTGNGIEVTMMAGAGNTFNLNNIYNNGLGMYNDCIAGPIDAERNWWGDVDPSDDVGGVLGTTDYSPWLGAVVGTSPMTWYTNDFIQDAIDAALAGDIINVAAGTYNETLNIENRSDISIVGADKNTTIIKSSTSIGWGDPPGGNYGEGRQTMVRVVGSTDIDFSNFTFDFDLMKTAVPGISYVSGILYWSSTGIIDNNILKNIGILDDATTVSKQEHTIYVRAMTDGGYSHAARADVDITNNEFINTGRAGVNTHDYVNATIDDNLFHKDAPYNGSGSDYDLGYAIEVGSESIGTVTDNTIYGYEAGENWTSAGIYIENAFTNDVPSPGFTKTVSVEGNEVYNCEVGVTLGCESTWHGEVSIVVNFSDNNIHDNRLEGVRIVDHDAGDGSSVTVNAEDNTITNNGDYGYYIFTNGDGNVTFTAMNETITNHSYGMYVDDLAPASSVYAITIDSSNISNNTTYGLYNNITTIVTATKNWWGDNTGPYHLTINPSGLGDTVSDNVVFIPWKTTIYNPATGLYYLTIQNAINDAGLNDTIVLDCGTYNEHLTINQALTLTSYCSTSVLDGTGFKGGTGITVTSPGVIIHNQTIQYWDTGIFITSIGSATIDSCKIINNAYYGICNDNTSVVIDAEHNWWGDDPDDGGGPLDDSDDRSTGGYYNPGGTGDKVSDYIDYYPWYVSDGLNNGCVGIGIYNPSCAYLEVKVTPDSDMNGYITNLIFTVSWDEPTVSLTDITPSYGITLQYHTTSGGKNYAVFGMLNQSVNWTAGTEYTILTFRHDESGSGTSDFEIATDTWAFTNNANYYLEYWGSNYTGLIYAIAEDVYLASCDIEVKTKVLLQGPYNTSANLMNTDLQTNGDVPTGHPYGGPPWNFPGSETVSPIPANYVDWVLVELRDANNSANVIDKSVGLLFNDGTIKDTSLTHDIRFNNIMPLTDYFIAVWHRNHMPVMSEAAVNIPNAAVYNFSDTLNFPPHGGGNNALVNLETGVYGMIAGDVNNDGKLIYSGANNDRGEILDTIVAVTGNSSITGTIQGYYWEDLTMNDWVKYSGVGNDQRLIILNLIELTGVYSLTSVYNSLVPGAVTKAGTFSPHTGPFDVALAENSDFLEVIIRTKEEIKDGFIDNIQFTLSWDGVDDEIDEMINKYQSDYKIEPQGSIVMQQGRKYQIFAVVDWMALPNPLNVGEDIAVLRFDKNNVTGTLAKRIEIAEDSFTNSNNGDYYISLIGKDHTGEILDYTVLSAEETAGQNAYVKYYPNPSNKGKVTMNFVSGSTGEFTISITDISSREVWQQIISVNGNKPYIEVLDIQGLSRGIYIISVKGAGIVMNDKLIIN